MMHDGGLAPGIYFGLDERVYHADKALSRSDAVNLLDTPNTYWTNSWMNAERIRKPSTDAMDYGQAFHFLLFEPHKFEKRYQVVPIDAWDVTKEKIQYDDYMAIIESIKVLKSVGGDSKLFLTGGMPEVTIIFDDGGMRFRTRHDYFTPVTSVDFKTAEALNDWKLQNSFKRYGYDIQLYLYKRARQRFKEQFLDGTADIYGDVDQAFFQKFMDAPLNDFVFIFQRKTKPYPFKTLYPKDDTEESGLRRLERAVMIYAKNRRAYGTNYWPVCDGRAREFSMFYGTNEDEG